MHAKKIFLFLLFALQSFCKEPLLDEFKQVGYVEIANSFQPETTFDALYAHFDVLIEFLQKNPIWIQKLYNAKERFIRSKDQHFYSTDFFGLYDESKKGTRGQIAVYYSPHFHEFVFSYYPELNQIPEIARFFKACFEIQKPYEDFFKKIACELNLETIFSSSDTLVPILFKVVKYLPSYIAARPHYDGTAFSLFLDSTDNESLLLSPYKSSFTVDDFSVPLRAFSKRRSILLIPGAFLTEFSIYPTPHIVKHNRKVRYATIAFAMRPNYIPQKTDYSFLPNFKD